MMELVFRETPLEDKVCRRSDTPLWTLRVPIPINVIKKYEKKERNRRFKKIEVGLSFTD